MYSSFSRPISTTYIKKMRFVDIGINLMDPMFRGVYRDKQVHADDFHLVIERSKKANVEKMIITGTNLSESKEAVELISKPEYDGYLYCTVGCHPTRCREFIKHKDGPEAYLEELRSLVKNNPSVVAIGECGLDYDRLHFCDKETQKKYFQVQFDLAKESQLPMFLHNRNTNGDFIDFMQKHRQDFTHGVVHSFTGSIEEMQQLIDLGLYIGINGCSLKTQENLDVVKAIPDDKLMIETDGPWCDIRPTHASFAHLKNIPENEKDLYIVPNKKKEKFEMGLSVKSRCEPCSIGSVLYVIASVRNQDPQELSEIIWSNTCNIFFNK